MTPSPRTSLAGLLLAAACVVVVRASAWPEWRGPNRDGRSTETNLPTKWSPSGDNVAWSLPFGGISTPVIYGNRVYLQTITPGDLAFTQERLVAVDAETGKVQWEHKFSQYLSDVPQHRAGWASPAVDVGSGNIYMLTVSAELIALAPDGKVLWSRSMPEEYGAITTHGGRTTSPIIDRDKVIINVLLQDWGPDLGRPGNRYFAFDKRSGQAIWISSPQTKHYDTNYSTPIIADIKGVHALIVGGTDGVFYALQANTGKPIWSIEVSKRAILNSALFRDNIAYITHGEENLDSTEMGMIAAIDATGAGVLNGAAVKWQIHGFDPTYSSPVMDDQRLYSIGNEGVLGAFDLKTGAKLWQKTLGTEQKGSPVLGDGKLYVGTVNGRFYILKPSATGCEVLSENVIGPADNPDRITASPAISDGRLYVTTESHFYAIGTRRFEIMPEPVLPAPGARVVGQPTAVAQVQVFPYESLLDAGQKQTFTLKLFDANGNLIRSAPAQNAQWTLDQLPGTIGPDGIYTGTNSGAAGFVKATVDGVTGQARVRVIPPLPWSYNFDDDKAVPPWWTSNGKLKLDPAVPGVLIRPRDDTVGRRARIEMGKPDWSNLTVEADVRGVEMRRQRGDAGVINQRYVMVLFGNAQKIELHPWQAADEMTVKVQPFEWAANTWYHLKLRVENHPDGKTLVQGKVWPTGQPEPAKWTVEKLDTIPHRNGSPGLYGDGISDVHYDNFKVYKNQ